jgi:hypothetical protein
MLAVRGRIKRDLRRSSIWSQTNLPISQQNPPQRLAAMPPSRHGTGAATRSRTAAATQVHGDSDSGASASATSICPIEISGVEGGAAESVIDDHDAKRDGFQRRVADATLSTPSVLFYDRRDGQACDSNLIGNPDGSDVQRRKYEIVITRGYELDAMASFLNCCAESHAYERE